MDGHTTQPRLLHSVEDLKAKYGFSHSKIYRLLNAPRDQPLRLEAMKLGRRTLIPEESLQRLLANLPRYAA